MAGNSVFENIPDDMIYVIRTFLDFPSEMCLDSTSKTMRFVMRDIVQPRCKHLNVDKELDIEPYEGIDMDETFKKYAKKMSRHIMTLVMNGKTLTLIPPLIKDTPRLKHVHVVSPLIVIEDVATETHIFSLETVQFWRRIAQYLKSSQIERLCVYPPSCFYIGEECYDATPTLVDKICRGLIEEAMLIEIDDIQRKMKDVHMPMWILAEPEIMRCCFPNAQISYWLSMTENESTRQNTLNRLMLAVE